MAHISTLTGGVSESLASAIFLSEGYSVFTSLVPESFDLIIIDKDEEGKNVCKTVQIKTMKIRRDRNNELVVKGANNAGIPYSKDDVDYLLGVNLETGKAYLIPNAEQTEYWSKDEDTARKKWRELTLKGLVA